MASRPIVPLQARGEAAIGGGNIAKPQQKKPIQPEGRNRRALGDIGNVVPARGGIMDPTKANRPITRSFCAQLLANAQAAAVAENNKKQVPVNVDGAAGPGKKAAPPKIAQKKVIIKPKSEEVIVVSPDSKEVAKEKKCEDKKKEGKEGTSKKKKPGHTLTSVLTARSKAACGLTNRPKDKVFDIDSADLGNELAAVEYIEDMYKFYKEAEHESRPQDYIDSQPELNVQMRAILVDWLVDVHRRFELAPETFYLTINIIDRFLSVKTVPRRELQLVGISSMLMASKYEEIWAPEVNDFVCLSDRAYTHEQILVMEKTILGKLEWTLTVPTPYVFLVRFIKGSNYNNDQEVDENLVFYLGELGMMHYSAVIMYDPSMIAAAAVYAARSTLMRSPVWNETLRFHTGFTESDVIQCAKLLVSFHATAEKSKLQVVYRKYSSSERGAVALLPPAKALLPGGAAAL